MTQKIIEYLGIAILVGVPLLCCTGLVLFMYIRTLAGALRAILLQQYDMLIWSGIHFLCVFMGVVALYFLLISPSILTAITLVVCLIGALWGLSAMEHDIHVAKRRLGSRWANGLAWDKK